MVRSDSDIDLALLVDYTLPQESQWRLNVVLILEGMLTKQ